MAAAKAVGDLKPVLLFRPRMCHVWLSHPLAHAIGATLCGFKPQWERDVVVHARQRFGEATAPRKAARLRVSSALRCWVARGQTATLLYLNRVATGCTVLQHAVGGDVAAVCAVTRARALLTCLRSSSKPTEL